jgi:hypothetical protein
MADSIRINHEFPPTRLRLQYLSALFYLRRNCFARLLFCQYQLDNMYCNVNVTEVTKAAELIYVSERESVGEGASL